MQYSAVYQKHGKWYLGWVEEIPGVNTQGKTLSETKANLKEALGLILEVGKSMLEKERPHGKVIREKIVV
ncbi:MAG TPA: type II toxin-antitoxin system HicB family antitoxin [Candidatus Methylomirabilis sp.]|nr:type II toxin-antitoxin system HicB family antitoxin [Candidatus Methylomirabilis sp.]